MEWYLKVINSYLILMEDPEEWSIDVCTYKLYYFSFLYSLDSMLGTVWSIGYGPIYIGYGLAVFVPGLAVAIRRLHDIGKSGWYYLLVIIPIIGPIWLIILFVTEGEQGDNKYGPNPKNDNFENRDF